jgi:hypothetical protein
MGNSCDDPALTIRHSFDGHMPIRAELPFLSHTYTCRLSSGVIAEPHTLLMMVMFAGITLAPPLTNGINATIND